MRTITPTQPTFTATDFTASSDAASFITAIPKASSPDAMALSALRMAREAIARWTGGAELPMVAPRDVARISPQARWLTKTQRDLAAWIECGGFSQIADGRNPCLPPTLTMPVMYDILACQGAQERDRKVDALRIEVIERS